MVVEPRKDGQATAVLCSAGLDSAVLVAAEAQHQRVQPIYIAVGFAWEPAEQRMLDRLLAAPVFQADVRPVACLALSMRDLYPESHWAIRGDPPTYDTPDADVYLMGRNAVLLANAAVFCADRGIGRIAIGSLAGNPFPDASSEFYDAMARALSLGLAHDITIVAPLATRHKPDVIRLGLELKVPLALTLSCMRPVPDQDRHCGLCSKCRERRDAFDAAGVSDPTDYAAPSPR